MNPGRIIVQYSYGYVHVTSHSVQGSLIILSVVTGGVVRALRPFFISGDPLLVGSGDVTPSRSPSPVSTDHTGSALRHGPSGKPFCNWLGKLPVYKAKTCDIFSELGARTECFLSLISPMHLSYLMPLRSPLRFETRNMK